MKNYGLHTIFITTLILVIALLSCSKDPEPVQPALPEVATNKIFEITNVSARCEGKVISGGSSTIIEKGICWDTLQTPTIDDNHINGIGSVTFTCDITGLSVYTTYYVRTYAINSVGIAYGNEISFATQGGSMTDIDSNIYQTISIGSQVWMTENLKTTRYRNGDSIAYVTDNSTWYSPISLPTPGAYCYYKNDLNNKNIYGGLYNWYAVLDQRKLAPEGWHIPTEDEWKTLDKYIENSGGKLKQTGTSHWKSPNVGATNETGFTGLAGGLRDFTGSYSDLFNIAYFWSSTQYESQAGGWYWFLHYDSDIFDSYGIGYGNGLSVRCVRD